MRDRNTADVVIVGAGVAGCAAAYYLTTMGARPVVVEREGVAAAASGFAQGGLYIMSGAGMDGPFFPLVRESLRMHRELHPVLAEATGLDSRLAEKDILTVALEHDDLEALRILRAQQEANGFTVEWHEGVEVRELEPGIGPSVLGGMLTRHTWLLDSETLTRSLMRAAERNGAEIRIAGASGLRWNGDRANGVELDDGGAIECDNVVLAMGPWSAHLREWIGVDVPVRPIKGEILRIRTDTMPAMAHIGWLHSYLVRKPDGLLWTGTTEDDVGFDREPSASAAERIMAGARRVFPAIDRGAVELHTACLRPVAPDNAPIIGPVPGLRGVYLATGAGRKGILAGPALGKATADLITTGATSLPIETLGLDRFL
ncbi:MAG: FAD-dependent oxidoreductase [Chloroflexota bacterium]|nr:FAD-dependent oxidoreductase [Chloroflexota bacterium]